jgi:hypothetical protein
VAVVDLRLTLAVAVAEMVAVEAVLHKTQMEAVVLQILAVAVVVVLTSAE